MIGSLLRDIYCMDIWQAMLLTAMGTYGFTWLEKKFYQRHIWRLLKSGALVILLVAIAYTTLGIRDGTYTTQQMQPLFQSYRDIRNGGNPELYRSNFMNALLFYPAGLLGALLLPRKWAGWCRCILVVLALTAMSAGIEFLQYRYALGRCEIDDVIHNTAGALIGCLAALWMPKLLAYLKDKMRSKAASDA